MKKLNLLFTLILVGLFSCNSHTENTTTSNTDSTSVNKEDHVAVVVPDTNRIRYHQQMTMEMDSMKIAFQHDDSLAMRSKAHADWDKTKTWFNARMDSLNTSMKNAESNTATDWQKFKMDMDKARWQFKHDWNKAMESMKFKPKNS